ncbi:reverse transcriptase domain-containing protein [Tanacetum coccineum]
MYTDKKTPLDNGQHEVSFVSNRYTQIVQEKFVSSKVLPCQLPPKVINPGNFTLPCTIRRLDFYVLADLGASVNVIPKSMFEHLKLAQLKKTDMPVEMADMTKISPIGIVENVLVKIDKFLFLSDFMVMDMLKHVGHAKVSEPVKKTLLKTWLLDCFQEELVKDPRSRSFDDYKWMFDLEVDQLADEYELGIGKKGHMLDDI